MKMRRRRRSPGAVVAVVHHHAVMDDGLPVTVEMWSGDADELELAKERVDCAAYSAVRSSLRVDAGTDKAAEVYDFLTVPLIERV